jgi:DNA polymerase IV
MDAFFASVEQRDDPSLRGKPVLVGGSSRRGVVAAASYEARPFGVRSAMPMAEALRRCPSAVVVPVRHGRYAEVSEDVFAIFRRYTPLVEGLSLDEAFLDVTASRALFGDGAAIARLIKAAIHEETGLTASAGVAPNKFVAKIASDLRKPDGLVIVPPNQMTEILSPLSMDRMWGVGPKASERLREYGLRTIGDLARADVAQLTRALGSWGTVVHELAQGIDDRPVVPDRAAESVGAEETYDQDLTSREAIARCLLGQATRVARRLVKSGLSARIVVVKIKYADFTVRTRRTTLPEPVADTDSIFAAATSLLDRFLLDGQRVRLTGVSVSGLIEGPPPRSLFPDPVQDRRRRLEEVVGKVIDRFGAKQLTRAALLESDPTE